MKNNKINLILAAIAVSTIAMIILTKIVLSHFELFPICVSYTAVALLTALTVSDSRSTKSYSSR